MKKQQLRQGHPSGRIRIGSMEQLNNRLQNVVKRMQDVLQLGMFIGHAGSTKWCSTDVGVQNQALRAISEFLANLPPSASSIAFLKASFEEVLAALEGLLQAENEQVQCKAADVSVALVSTCSGFLPPFGAQGLVGPLARLLSSTLPSTVTSAAIALKSIIERVKLRGSISAAFDKMLNTIREVKTVEKLIHLLETVNNDLEVLIASAELLAVILERSPTQRFTVGSRTSLRSALFEYSASSNEFLAQAALRALSSLALCAGVAALITQDIPVVLAIAEQCLVTSRSTSVKTEVLHLLVCVMNFSKFLFLIHGHDIGAIAIGCVKALEDSCVLQDKKWSPEMEILSLVAARATSLLLSVPGEHHLHFLKGGIMVILSSALLPRNQDKDWEPGNLFSSKKSSAQLQTSLWESLGWIGCHFTKSEEALHFTQDSSFSAVIDYLCAAFFRAVLRRGRRYQSSRMVEEGDVDKRIDSLNFTTQEAVQICRGTLLFISSTSQRCSSPTRLALEHHLQPYGCSALSSLVDSLSVGYDGDFTVKPDKLETLARLYALSALCYLPVCKQELVQSRVLEVVVNMIKEQRGSIYKTDPEGTWALSSLVVSPMGSSRLLKPCCSQGNDSWFGNDHILFASLWTLSLLLHNSDLAREVQCSMPDEPSGIKIPGGDIVDLLWTLAGEKESADGIRWWAACGLACFGLYGFPSGIGKSLSRILEDSSLADVLFLFPNGSHLRAHGVILAARCPTLLPVQVDESSGNTTCKERTVRISARVPYRALKSILKYIYTGVVRLEAKELADVKGLAKRCQLAPLLTLLRNATPIWGSSPDTCSIESALGSFGHQFFDIVLQSPQRISPKPCSRCELVSDHVHAHRAILSSRCDYFEALFRSGMRDSYLMVVGVPERSEVIMRFVQYLYSDELHDPPDISSDCAWNSLNKEKQLQILEELIDLADIAEQWLHEELQKTCVELILHHLRSNLLLCPRVMEHAAMKKQWDIVAASAECMAPEYPQLRESGGLDGLDDELVDTLRASYVKLSLSGPQTQGLS